MNVNIPEDYKSYLRIGTCSWSLFPGGIKLPDIGYVYLEGYYMPHIGEVYEKFQPATADFCIVRLHGGGRLEMETQTGGLWDRKMVFNLVTGYLITELLGEKIFRENIEKFRLSDIARN